MFSENQQMRQELHRITQILTSFLDREKALVQMLEELTDVHASLVGQVFSHTQQSVGQAQASMQGVKQGKARYTDPIMATENELKRINSILAAPAVAPPSASQMAQISAHSYPAPSTSPAPPSGVLGYSGAVPPSGVMVGYSPGLPGLQGAPPAKMTMPVPMGFPTPRQGFPAFA